MEDIHIFFVCAVFFFFVSNQNEIENREMRNEKSNLARKEGPAVAGAPAETLPWSGGAAELAVRKAEGWGPGTRIFQKLPKWFWCGQSRTLPKFMFGNHWFSWYLCLSAFQQKTKGTFTWINWGVYKRMIYKCVVRLLGTPQRWCKTLRSVAGGNH